jgi:hypothetical protein
MRSSVSILSVVLAIFFSEAVSAQTPTDAADPGADGS